MPNELQFNYPDFNNMNYNPYLNIQNKILELEKRIKNLENRIKSLENNKQIDEYDYQTSMNMM